MFLEIITPEEKLFSGEVTSATFPGMSGQFQVLKNHAPIVSTLDKGKIKIATGGKDTQSFEVKGGVVEVLNNKIVVLAEV
jgi:F-type H+-transporting ATPase subunit epsilon